MKIAVKEVPYMKWLSVEGIERVARFNSSNEELVLDLYNLSEDCTRKEVLSDCEDGYFNYIYSNLDNEVVKDLKEVIEDSAENGHYFYFTEYHLFTEEDTKTFALNVSDFLRIANRHGKDEPNYTVHFNFDMPLSADGRFTEENFTLVARCATEYTATRLYNLTKSGYILSDTGIIKYKY